MRPVSPSGDPTCPVPGSPCTTWDNCRESPGPIRTRRLAQYQFRRGPVRGWAWASSRCLRATPGEAITSKGETPGLTHPDNVARARLAAAPSHNNNKGTWRQDGRSMCKGGQETTGPSVFVSRWSRPLQGHKKHIPGGCTLAGDNQLSTMRQQNLK